MSSKKPKRQGFRSTFQNLFRRTTPPSATNNGTDVGSPSSSVAPASGTVSSSSATSPRDVTTTAVSPPANVSQRQPETTQNEATPSKMDAVKDYLSAAGSLTIALLKKVPNVIDENPIKIAFGLAKTVIEISELITENRTAVEQQVVWTSAQLLIVETSLAKWEAKTSSEIKGIESFERKLGGQLKKLVELKEQSLLRRIATHEDVQKELSSIFSQVNQAREELILETQLAIHRTIHTIRDTLAKSLVRDLKPAEMADHKYHTEGQERQLLRREVCTPGTRLHILDAIKMWAENPSSAESVYWLFGSAGSGKSTIAYTIATQTDTSISSITLGGNFFCSRQFESTRYSKRIVPTIAYHLAHQCPPFAEALAKCDFDVIHRSPRAQLEELLAKPWLKTAATRALDPSSPPSYLIIVDALDEIEGDGGTELLRSLLDMINDQQLPGLRFFVTSRPNPSIVSHVESFRNKKLYRLEEIPMDEAEADIGTYLNATLPHFKGSKLMRQLIQLAAGLFIFAATVAKHLTIRYPGTKEQRIALKKLISASTQTGTLSSPKATETLDQLYNQILVEAFEELADDLFPHRLRIIHTFLCTAERTSTAIVSHLLPDEEDSDDSDLDDTPAPPFTEVADDVVKRLYSVLYIENGRVLSYHKSFPDFIFDQARSGRFWCNQPTLHRLLASSCFGLMADKLRFNIADLPSSYVLDQDNPALQDEVQLEQKIPFHLRYACRHWAHHLKAIGIHNEDNTPLFTSLADFMDLRALFWIEAMTILGWTALCDPILQTAYDFVPPDNPTLQPALAEAAGFALYFTGNPASLSTPHLYISALATCVRAAYPVSKWKSHFPNIPHFTSGESRSAALMTIDVGSVVGALAISDDRKLIAIGSADTIQLCDASVGKVLKVLKGHYATISSLSFFRDNLRLVSTSIDGTVRMWEVETGRELRIFGDLSGSVWSAAVSSDSTRIVSGSEDMLVRVWDVETGKLVRRLDGHQTQVLSVAFSDSPSEWICSGSQDGAVLIWDANTGHVLPSGVLRGHSNSVLSVAFSPSDNAVVSASDDNTIRTWDPVTGTELAMLEDDRTHGARTAAFSRDGSKVIWGGGDGNVYICDRNSWEVTRLMEGCYGPILAALLSADGKRVVSFCANGLVQVWDALVASSPQGNLGRGRGRVDIFSEGILRLAVSRDGAKILSGSGDGTVSLWDANTGNHLLPLEGHTDAIHSVAFLNEDSTILSISDDSTIRLWDASTGKTLKAPPEIETDSDITCACASHDGLYMLMSLRDANLACIWDVSEGRVIQLLEGHTSYVSTVTFSSNGTYAGTGSGGNDQTARVWEALSGRLVWVLEGHTGEITSIKFSHDCLHVGSASLDKSTRLWDMAAGTCVWVSNGPDMCLFLSINFSPNDSIIASGSRDHTIWLWDVRTGEVLDILEGHTERVRDVVFSPDGRKVISCSQDGTMRVWNASRSGTDTKQYRIQKQLDPSSGRHRRTGWLLDSDRDDLLMCCPLEDMVPDPSHILSIPASAAPSVTYSHTTLGLGWEGCYIAPN